MYTLTSGSAAGDPSDWKLEGSQDGASWTDAWTRAPTRPSRGGRRPARSAVAHPQAFRMYRLVFTGSTKASLAEVELLVKPSSRGAAKLTVTPTSTALTGRTGSTVSATLGTFVAARKSTGSDYTATIDWGDGSTSPGTLSAGQLNSYARARLAHLRQARLLPGDDQRDRRRPRGHRHRGRRPSRRRPPAASPPASTPCASATTARRPTATAATTPTRARPSRPPVRRRGSRSTWRAPTCTSRCRPSRRASRTTPRATGRRCR